MHHYHDWAQICYVGDFPSSEISLYFQTLVSQGILGILSQLLAVFSALLVPTLLFQLAGSAQSKQLFLFGYSAEE